MLLPFDTIARSRDFDERAGAMQLRPWQWEFLHGADGRVRLGDLASRCGIDFDTAANLVHETEALGLVDIVTLSLDGYRTAAAPAPALAAPRSAVSVSFDSFSSALTAWDAPGHDALTDVPASEPAARAEPAAECGTAADVASWAELAPAKKNVTFSLSADSFGLPSESFDVPRDDAQVEPTEPDGVAPVPAEEGGNGSANGAIVGEPLTFEAGGEDRANGDLTGVVLRALGLRK